MNAEDKQKFQDDLLRMIPSLPPDVRKFVMDGLTDSTRRRFEQIHTPHMNPELVKTIGNLEWLQKNEEAVKKLLPDTWTHMENLEGLRIGFGLKLLGVDWRSEQEFGGVMVCLEKLGLMLRQNGFQVMANPRKVFA